MHSSTLMHVVDLWHSLLHHLPHHHHHHHDDHHHNDHHNDHHLNHHHQDIHDDDHHRQEHHHHHRLFSSLFHHHHHNHHHQDHHADDHHQEHHHHHHRLFSSLFHHHHDNHHHQDHHADDHHQEHHHHHHYGLFSSLFHHHHHHNNHHQDHDDDDDHHHHHGLFSSLFHHHHHHKHHKHHKELNNSELDGRGSDHSLNSLPSVQTAGLASERSVASWAVSFERLLQDPLGVEYFKEFLQKEYSAENIDFWKSCEKYHNIPADDAEQLMQEARRIYNEYLSSTSLCPVNVDQQAVITEKMLEKPTPDLFNIQQLQIFNLMKFDSYARFVKSPLYQECMLSEVEGRPLPNLHSSPTSLSSGSPAITSGAVKKKKLRPGKSLPLGVETTGLDNVSDVSRGNSRSFKRKDRRGKDTLDSNGLSSRHESEGSLNSATSLDLSIISNFSGKSEHDSCSLGSTDRDADSKPIKYCCVYLPDGTASLTAVKPGLTIREMLAGVCEKRGYNSSDVKVYLAGNEKKALALDQECTVLTDQEIKLENRISFDLQIEPMNKSLRIVSKPTKTINEAIQSALKKYGLGNQQVVLQKMGESHALDLAASVSQVAGETLVLQVHTDMNDATNARECTVDVHTKVIQKEHVKEKHGDIRVPRLDLHHWTHKEAHHHPHHPHPHPHALVHRRSGITPDKQKIIRKNQDIEGLVEMLNRVQNTRADDQRGLLSKEDLVLPEFLKLPADATCDNCQTISQDLATRMETVPQGPDISTVNYNEENISPGSTLPALEATCCPSSDIENTNASTHVSIDSYETAAKMVIDNVTSPQMGETCTNEKDTLL